MLDQPSGFAEISHSFNYDYVDGLMVGLGWGWNGVGMGLGWGEEITFSLASPSM
jgi:hypothetical protein